MMWVRLLRDYRNYRKGSVLELDDIEAVELLASRGVARAKEGDYMRNISSPPHDKMVREPRLQK
jgi:hypothetical protein